MPAYVLTGTPSSGKTALLRQLEVDGYPVVEEAATDVIALWRALGRVEPWRDAAFIDAVVELQCRRWRGKPAGVVFVDRSPVCTLALSRYLDLPPTRRLVEAVAELESERTVFLVRNLGFVERTAARRITLEESLLFERIHEQTYREQGYDLVDVPAGPLPERVALVKRQIGAHPPRVGDQLG
jgi:predicted ATPase